MKGKKTMKTETNTAHPVRHKVFTAVGIILCAVLIPIIIINCTLIFKQFSDKDKVPSVGGVFPMIVLTDSMKGTFDSGSLLICRTAEAKDVQIGDIICFYDPVGNGTATATHRVMKIETDEAGNISFITKGDASNTEDLAPVPASRLIGVYKSHIAGLGSFALFMQSTPGLILFVALPVLILIGYDMLRHRIYEKKKDGDADALMEELEALRAEKAAGQTIPGTASGEDKGQ